MKRVIGVGLLAAAIVMSSAALSAASARLSGSYTTSLSKPAFLRGSYRLTFTAGRFVVRGPGGFASSGTDRISGSRITIRGSGLCKAAGTYSFRLSRRAVTFHKINDPCPRASLITGRSWTRA